MVGAISANSSKLRVRQLPSTEKRRGPKVRPVDPPESGGNGIRSPFGVPLATNSQTEYHGSRVGGVLGFRRRWHAVILW